MEVEDPISAKFRTIVEALMIKTTSEIVKVFADVMLETRMEISRSWREIDDLKQELEQREKQRAESNFRSQMTQVTFKTEEDDVVVSQQSPVILESTESRGEVQISEDATVEETDTGQNSVSGLEQAAPEITTRETSVPEAQVTQLEVRHKRGRPSTSHTVSKHQTSVPEAQVTQLEGRHKRGRPSTSHTVSAHQTSARETKVLPNSPIQALSVASPQKPSSSTDSLILSNRSQGKRAVVSKKKYMQKRNTATQSNSVTHTLRDRHLLSSQKPCLCCTSGQCPEQQHKLKKNSPVASCGYTCTDCGTKFQERTEFKSHKCFSKPKCNRCGQTFTSLRTLASHNRRVPPALKKPFPYKCYLCDHMFATRCGWNIHKRIHAHGHVSEIGQQDIPSPSHSFPVPKELKAKVEVRLERISEAQLEAALFPKGSLLLDDKNSVSSVGPSKNLSSVVEPTPFTGSSNKPSTGTTRNASMLNKESVSNSYTELVMECQASSSGTESSESFRQSDDGTEDSVFPTAASKNQPAEKWTQSKSLIARRVDSVECDEGSSSASEDLPKGLNSLSRKRKMSDCNHDMYNGVFPVEKILRWRNTKGRNEVRIKWMPCSLCGAKWKNTWEPAESFISYKDGKNEETGNIYKQN
ncbi:zinc finger protein 813 [Pangasianodon hypophthalmus]|uniref:zinc finger protein 813 n=1 Tax=Pangasianodon hypophthalmus TaxID=310915 RepID=UPI0023080517|nr:zinc finger protein 813 [Pangasianodon hypophthalmus]